MQAESINPLALPVPTAALLLSRVSGEEITEKMIYEDIQAGAPVNTDGTLNLVHYAAWLLKEISNHA